MSQILDDITFDRIKGQLLEAAGVQISDEDLNKFALIVAKNQFAMYGMTSVPDELLENYAQSMLKDERTKENLIDRVADSKLLLSLRKRSPSLRRKYLPKTSTS